MDSMCFPSWQAPPLTRTSSLHVLTAGPGGNGPETGGETELGWI